MQDFLQRAYRIVTKNANETDLSYTNVHACLAHIMLVSNSLCSVYLFQVCYSLSRREESWENKLSACLLACVSAGSKKHRLVTIFIRVDRRVIGVEEFESGVSFLKFFLDRFFTQRTTFFTKKMFVIRVDRRVIGVEEFESGVSFLKIFLD